MADSYSDDVNKINDEIISIGNELQNQANIVSQIAVNFVRYKDAIKDAKAEFTDLKNIKESLLVLTSRLGNSYVDQNDLIKYQNRLRDQAMELSNQRQALDNRHKDSLSKIGEILKTNNILTSNNLGFSTDISAELVNIQKEIDTINSKKRKSSDDKKNLDVLNLQKQAIIDIQSEYDTAAKFIQTGIDQTEKLRIETEKISKEIEKGNELYRSTTRELTVMSRLLSGISKIPVIGQLYDMKSLSESAKLGVRSLTKDFIGQSKEILSSTIVKIGIAAFLWSKVIGYIKQGIKLALEFNKAITETANRLAISQKSAEGLYSSFYQLSQSSEAYNGTLYGGLLTMKNMGTALGNIEDAFGTSALVSDELLKNQILLTKQMGFTEEQAAGIQKYAILQGKTAEQTINTILRQNKALISNKKLIAEISKVNAEIATSYKNQPDLIAKAAVQAMKLGMTLEDTRKISDSLLNFESSIENELKAELLLGKQLNYEKARALALDGRSAEAAAELVSEAGGLNYYNNLNVIQRKALAESIGLSSEELTKFAQQQEVLNKLDVESVDVLAERHKKLMDQGKTAEALALIEDVRKQRNGEMLAQDIAKMSLAARFEASMDKIKEVFIKMAEPLEKVLNLVLSVIENLGAMKEMVKAFSVILGFATGAATGTAAFGVIGGLVGGIAGGLAGMYATKDISDGIISPSKGLLISTPKGEMFRTDPDDNVYATPKLPNEISNLTKPELPKINNKIDATEPVVKTMALPEEKSAKPEAEVLPQKTTLVNTGAKEVRIEKIVREKEVDNTTKVDNTEVVAKLQEIVNKMTQKVNIDSYDLFTRASLSSNISYA